MIVSEDSIATLAGSQSALTQWMELQADVPMLVGSHVSEGLCIRRVVAQVGFGYGAA